jgi:hypothetical protein
MPGLVPGIHAFSNLAAIKAWMAGTSPAMTLETQADAVCGFTDCRFCVSLFRALM